MLDLSHHYVSGEEIRAGDRARLAGVPGRVVFVLSYNEVLPEFVECKEWFLEEYGHGFMFEQTGGGLVFQHESNEDFEFVSRGENHAA